eukprot:GHVR01071239.1.p1 GENE.GHVR01071239.1~~GHVR01071239.1.p1  ORF type:complete len:145 (-),score=3.59 GHVR01071239.1:185-619(-)
MNTVKGFSNKIFNLDLDDGTKIHFIIGQMAISGMLFGERSFNFVNKIYAYDLTNNMFAELIFGPIKKNFFDKSQLSDFISGNIYSLNDKFKDYYDHKKPNAYPSNEHKVEDLCSISGSWTESIQFGGVEYLNVVKYRPFDLKKY